jgi:hypothetical protein
MAISKKNKNRVLVNGTEYLWWVFDEYDQTEFDGIQIKIVCADQTHFIKYGLQQFPDDRKVVLALENYTKLVHLSSPPVFENKEGIITKSGVQRLIKWCKAKNHTIGYAVDNGNFKLSDQEKHAILKELQEKIY